MFGKSLTVAELMLENPQEVVIDFQSALVEKRLIPLPADKKLEMKKLYMVLPIKRSVKSINLSSKHIQPALHVLRSKSLFSLSKFLNLIDRMCPAMPRETH